MNIQEILFLLLLFVAVFVLILLFNSLLSSNVLKARIKQLKNYGPEIESDEHDFVSSLVRVVDPISKLSLPKEGWEKSPIHISFLNAGWRNSNAPKLYFGIKALLPFILPFIVYFFIDRSVQVDEPQLLIFILCVVAAIGYYIPNFVLARIKKMRQQDVINNLPDATDLLLICVEAGLSFDQALGKVASEIKIKSKVLSEELTLVLMEMRSGFNRQRALKNLALRVGVEQVDMLATMINQSERFGTSIGDALRVYADTARTKRRQRAEEQAAKIAVKLLFPLMFCLFPCMFIVLLVPSLVNLLNFFS